MTFETKTDALDHFERSKRQFLEQARAVARFLLAPDPDRAITVDDVRAVIQPPPDVDPRVMGAIFNTKDFEAVGFVQSKRSACHNRPIRAFRLRRGYVSA